MREGNGGADSVRQAFVSLTQLPSRNTLGGFDRGACLPSQDILKIIDPFRGYVLSMGILNPKGTCSLDFWVIIRVFFVRVYNSLVNNRRGFIMGIMNYVVRIKNVKVDRLRTMLNYLNDGEHKNHTKKNTEIIELSNRERFEEISNEKIVRNLTAYKKNAKGGRPLSVYGKSLTFNIPREFDFDMKTSERIYEDLVEGIKELYQNLPPFKKGEEGESYDLREEEIYSVLHNQENPHYHIVIPYLTANGETIRGTKSRVFLSQLKALWSEIMVKHYGISLEEYQPASEEVKNLCINRRFLEDLEEYYQRRLDINPNLRYEKSQMTKIKRMLRLTDEELESEQSEKNLDGLEKSYQDVERLAKVKSSPIMRI